VVVVADSAARWWRRPAQLLDADSRQRPTTDGVFAASDQHYNIVLRMGTQLSAIADVCSKEKYCFQENKVKCVNHSRLAARCFCSPS